MKREAVGHTKMKRLMRRMDWPQWQAIGLLEALWQFTAKQAPRGDIGRYSDEEIALGLDYRGDEIHLIQVLCDIGWLDRSPEHRLIVHDWSEHADRAIHKRLSRAGITFADGKTPWTSKTAKCPSMDVQKGKMDVQTGQMDALTRTRDQSQSQSQSQSQTTTAALPGSSGIWPEPDGSAPSSRSPRRMPRSGLAPKPAPEPTRPGGPKALVAMLDPPPDAAGAARLLRDCLAHDPDCTLEDIAVAWATRAKRIGPNVRNPVGVLLTATPSEFESGAERRAKARAHAAERAEAEAAEARRIAADWRRIAEDPAADPDDRLLAQWALDPQGCATLADYRELRAKARAV